MVAQTSTSRRYGHRLRRERFTERLTADEIQLKTKPKPTSEPLPQAELETVTASLKESMIKGQGGQDNQVEERVEKGKGRRQAASGAKTPVDELASLEKVVVDKEKNQGQASSSTKKIFKELARLKKVVAGK
jgi:hypothetical protein